MPRPLSQVFGLSTTPVADIKTELQKEIDRVMLRALYNGSAK